MRAPTKYFSQWVLFYILTACSALGMAAGIYLMGPLNFFLSETAMTMTMSGLIFNMFCLLWVGDSDMKYSVEVQTSKGEDNIRTESNIGLLKL